MSNRDGWKRCGWDSEGKKGRTILLVMSMQVIDDLPHLRKREVYRVGGEDLPFVHIIFTSISILFFHVGDDK